jgi:hypothetical protein
MTLLVSVYTSRGIVFAADSQITGEAQPGMPSERREPQEKVQRAKRVGAAPEGAVVGYFGLAQVGGVPMDGWLRERLDRFNGARTVDELAFYLCDELNGAAKGRERRVSSGFHIGGLEERDGILIPVMQFLRNTTHFDLATGVHSNFVPYWTEEHFPSCNLPGVPPASVRAALHDHEQRGAFPFWFRNGDLGVAGRPWASLEHAVAALAALPSFGPISDLKGFEQLAKTLVDTTSRLYALLYRGGAPLIGGRTLIRTIPW